MNVLRTARALATGAGRGGHTPGSVTRPARALVDATGVNR